MTFASVDACQIVCRQPLIAVSTDLPTWHEPQFGMFDPLHYEERAPAPARCCFRPAARGGMLLWCRAKRSALASSCSCQGIRAWRSGFAGPGHGGSRSCPLGSVAEKGEKTLQAPEPSFPNLAALSAGSGWQESFTTNNSILLANPAYCHLPPLSYRREPAMPMVRPMSGLAAIVQTWPLGDSIGVRQQYPTLCPDTLRYVLTTHLFGPVTT